MDTIITILIFAPFIIIGYCGAIAAIKMVFFS